MANSTPAQPFSGRHWPLFQNPLAAYGAAIALTALAFALRWYLDPMLGNSSRLAFAITAAAASALLFGCGPGIASTVIGVALGDYFFYPPRYSFAIANTGLTIGLFATAFQGIIMSLCAGVLHRALRIRAAAEKEVCDLLELERRAHEAAQELNQTKDYFLAVLSHELRGPLAAIQYSATAQLADPTLPLNQRSDLELIDRNARMQSRLITDLLDFTRLTRGKMQLEPHPLDLHLLLAEAIRTSAAPGEDIVGAIPTLHLHAHHTWVNADRDGLLQVFWNILRNARKFTPRDGRIEVETYDSSPGRIGVRIRDTGVGLSPEDFTRIFHPFEQAASAFDKKQGGLGLGLAVARGLVELHAGQLTGESEGPGRGCTFTVELPLHENNAAAKSPRRSTARPSTGSEIARAATTY